MKIITGRIFSGISKLFFLFLIISCKQSQATHISGADLTYKSLGNYQYEFTLVLYRDCAGIPVQNPELLRCVNASGGQTTFNVYLIANTGNEITFPCFSSLTTCSGGSNPGYQRYEYRGSVTLGPSPNWIISWEDCCRNCAITTTNGGCSNSYLIEVNFNNLLFPNDNSPSFTNYPVSFVCLNQNFTYNHGVIDPEGDSLVYYFINPRLTGGSPVSFKPGYSAVSFITSSSPITLNPSTGDINFTPSDESEVAITAIRVDCYRNGVFIGNVMRDIQFQIENCTPNVLPTATGINGSNSFDTLICSGTPLCFDIYSNDLNVDQTLTVTWNNGIPGGTFTTNGAQFPTATFCWTPSQSDARTQPHTFTILVKDDNCRYNSYQVYSYRIFVPFVPFDSLIIQPHCDTSERGSIYMEQEAVGQPFTWQWDDGPDTPVRTGLIPGNYSVTITNVIGCFADKTFTIYPPPPRLQVVCELTDTASTISATDGSLTAIASGGTEPYSFEWSNGATTMVNPGLAVGDYQVTVTDTFGCQAVNSCEVVSRCPSIVCSGTTTSCSGYNNASATVTVSGDTAGLSIQWNHNPLWNTRTIRNLRPGTYTVVVSNANGCLDSCSVTIPSEGCGGFRDYTQGGYGAIPKGKNVANYLKSKFSNVFPGGLSVGCINFLNLTNWQAVVDFLPSGGTARSLPPGTLVNPGITYSNVLAGQVVAAKLNISFDSADANFSPSSILLKNLVIARGTFTGWTVLQLLEEANRALGGCGSAYSFSALTEALDKVNNNYDYNDYTNSQLVNKCFLSCPVGGSNGYYRRGHPEVTDIPETFSWNVFPNPARSFANIQFVANEPGNISIDILDFLGTRLNNWKVNSVKAGESGQVMLPIQNAAPGVYSVVLTIGSRRYHKKLVIL